MTVVTRNHVTIETGDESPPRAGRRFNLTGLLLLLAALVFEFAGKSYASRAITTIARGGARSAVSTAMELSGLLGNAGLIVAACGAICAVVSTASGERGPHWPMMLAGGVYVVFLLVWV